VTVGHERSKMHTNRLTKIHNITEISNIEQSMLATTQDLTCDIHSTKKAFIIKQQHQHNNPITPTTAA